MLNLLQIYLVELELTSSKPFIYYNLIIFDFDFLHFRVNHMLIHFDFNYSILIKIKAVKGRLLANSTFLSLIHMM